jgi:hypothetical protein
METKPNNLEIIVTKNYEIFKKLRGNRDLDKRHINSLKKKMADEGNLTPDFPIVVNANMEVVDGQQRLQVLQELGWPVYYVVRPNLTIATVRQINLGRKNWSWLDYASSYANEGKQAYQDLLDFHELFKEGKNVLFRYCNAVINAHVYINDFSTGNFTILDKGETLRLLNQLKECRGALVGSYGQAFGLAMHAVMTNTNYEHKRMMHKFVTFGSSLQKWSSVEDYMRNIEDIYNNAQPESTRVRLF